MYCPRCGSKNSDLSHFCKSCGTSLSNNKAHHTRTQHPKVGIENVDKNC